MRHDLFLERWGRENGFNVACAVDDVQNIDEVCALVKSIEEKVPWESVDGDAAHAGEVRVLEEARTSYGWKALKPESRCINGELPSLGKPFVRYGSVILSLIEYGSYGSVTELYRNQAAVLWRSCSF